MANIIIKRVKYLGDFYHYESPILSPGLNIIEGPNGTGKSTFINFIYYALGGNVPEFKDNHSGTHLEINRDKNNYIELEAEIGGAQYVLRRYFDKNDIAVFDESEDILVLPIYRRDNNQTFSDWILSKLDIEVVEIYQGTTNWKICFSDLLRLIYHDQNPDPSVIYKKPERDNFVSDSETLRKIIFQLLMGKTFSDYYSNLASLKRLEKEKNISKDVLDQYSQIAESITNSEDLNIVFLEEKKTGLQDDLNDSYTTRENLKNNRPNSVDVSSNLGRLKNHLLQNEIDISDLNTKKLDVIEERAKLIRLEEDIILETTQIKKIIYSHKELGLFSPDTCPYCLKPVNRKRGCCVCGSEIEESEYEKYFYDENEYFDILKSKQKSVETLNLAIDGCGTDLNEYDEEINHKVDQSNQLRIEVKSIVGNIDNNVDINSLNDIDDEILEIRKKMSVIDQQIEIETKRGEYQARYDALIEKYEDTKRQNETLENKANEDISQKISEFNLKYNEIMMKTLKNCRSAKIGTDNYMPIINNGEYREASARVSVRLMYYFTLLYMSLIHSDVKFPRFLLVDNPQTSGIDLIPLQNSLKQIENLIPQNNENNYQIILATGVGIYPDSFKEHVFNSLSINDKLLKLKE
jgi:hypothetical protein